jgi:predicted alpha/beta hydrolase
MQMTSLKIPGYKGQGVPNTFYRQDRDTKHLGIVLPGFRFSADRAELYYGARILLERGADVLRAEYTYYETDYVKASDREQYDWLSKDASAVGDAGLSQRSYEKVTLLGKSLGTLAMGHLLGEGRFRSASCVWFTPILTDETLVTRIEQVRPRSLFIIGTADSYYKPDVLERLVDATRGRQTVIDRATHGLEIPGSIPESLDVLNRIVKDLQDFLA